MSIIKVKCTDQVLTFENTPVIASGGLGEDFVEFSFCSQWDGYARTAVFWRSENDAYHVTLDSNDRGQVPPEVTADEGVIHFGVFGVAPDGRQRTSEVLTYRIVKGAITTGTKPSDPTPDVYTQLLAKYAEVQADASQAAAAAEASASSAAASQKAAEASASSAAASQKAAASSASAAAASQKAAETAAAHTHTAADVGAVNKAGDTMTGNLTVEKATPIVSLNDTIAGTGARLFNANDRVYLQIQNDASSDANRRHLQLMDSEIQTIGNALALVDIVNGKATTYFIYHTGNKPTAADVGAFARNDGIGMDNGDPIIFPTTASGATRFRLYSGRNAVYGDGANLILMNKNAGTNPGIFELTARDGTNGSVLRGTPSGALIWANNPILHTGNLAANNIAKMVVGSYVGTGKAGENYPNSLTFTEAPLWVKIYQEGKYSDIKTDTSERRWGGLTFTLTEEYGGGQEWFYFRDGSYPFANPKAKKSADGKTISWYLDTTWYDEITEEQTASGQANSAGVTYRYIAVFA